MNKQIPDACAAQTVALTVNSRRDVHGDPAENFDIAQKLKFLVRQQRGFNTLSAVQAEAIDMIMVKVARILAGNPDFPDHWHDIGGYALIAEREAQEVQEAIEEEMASVMQEAEDRKRELAAKAGGKRSRR